MADYIVTNEATNKTTTFTNKRKAYKAITSIKKAGQHFTASIYEDGRRIDSGSVSAEMAICK